MLPFYQKLHEDNPTLTKSFDLLGRGLEITTEPNANTVYEVLKNRTPWKRPNPAAIQTIELLPLRMPSAWMSWPRLTVLLMEN